MTKETYALNHPERIASPALLYYKDIIVQNTQAVISIAGDPDRLWPHVKSHKMEALVRMQMEMGIRRFKCATITELRMVSACGAAHIIMAYPLVGPNIALFLDTLKAHPATTYYAIADSVPAAQMLSGEAAARGMKVNLLVDVNAGMDRTGITPDALAGFCRALAPLPGIKLMGFHCYDGHVHDEFRATRMARAHAPIVRVMEIRGVLAKEGIDMPLVIAGGSPTFPCHADEDVFLSPGTVFLWDWGYAKFADLPFVPAVCVLARVISHPAAGLFTIDVGNKAIAADPTGRRGAIVGLEDAAPVRHSEEHWVFSMPEGREDRPQIGDVLYVVPTHVCPTSALYREAVVVENGEVAGIWPVTARDRVSLVF